MTAKEIWDQANPSLSHESIIYDLLEAPAKIKSSEDVLHSAKIANVMAKDELEYEEGFWLTSVKLDDGSPVIDGKNEAIREAQLASKVVKHLGKVRNTEVEILAAEREYNFQINTFRALRSVAAILSGEVK